MDLDPLLDRSAPSVNLQHETLTELSAVIHAAQSGRRYRARRRHLLQGGAALAGILALGGVTAAAAAGAPLLPWVDPDYPNGASHTSITVSRTIVVGGQPHACSVHIRLDVPAGPEANAVVLASLEYLESAAPAAVEPDPNFLLPAFHADGSTPSPDADSYGGAWGTAVSEALFDHLTSLGLPASGLGVEESWKCE